VFYIGGTKCGALFGEAVVFTSIKAPEGFFSIIKQEGALLAKGRLLGIQFSTLFTGDLYIKICEKAVKLAAKIKKALKEKGVSLGEITLHVGAGTFMPVKTSKIGDHRMHQEVCRV